MKKMDVALALNRFGLGARPGDFGRVGSDPRGWLEGQIETKTSTPPAFADLPTADSIVRNAIRARQRGDMARKEMQKEHRALYRRESAARTRAMMESETPFQDRMVSFWSNHFTVSTARKEVVGVVGAYEREVIRPHVFGRFADLLGAVVRHPAMLVYLDNARSVGPNSRVGRRGRGLNENLAREILELHTLGVHGGYTQEDVTAFAEVLTGWGVVREYWDRGSLFRFNPAAHEPGSKKLLGRVVPEGEEGGEAVLAMLARHPSTATHVATKLVRHFVNDSPPKPAVHRIARVFMETDGDLAAVSRALVQEPLAWTNPLAKLKTPVEWVVSAGRALGAGRHAERWVRAQQRLGQMPLAAPSPKGWPDTAIEWIGPEALLSRLDLAEKAGTWVRNPVRGVVDRAEGVLGPTLSSSTRKTIASSVSGERALALLLVSPEFQRR